MELTLTRRPRQATGPFTPTQPRVNLLPHSAIERAATSRAKITAIITWVASIAAVAAWWGTGVLSANTATEALSDAQDRGQELSIELARFAPVTSIARQTRALDDTVASQTETEVAHSTVITRFMDAVGDTLHVESVQVSTSNTAACVSTDPFKQVPLAGCITFSGTAPAGQSAAPELISSLATDPWFSDPFIPNVGSTGTDGTPLSGTVGLTTDAYSTQAPTSPTTED